MEEMPKILPSLWNIGYKRKYYPIAPRGVCETLFTHRHFDYSSKNIFFLNCTILKPNTVLQTELQKLTYLRCNLWLFDVFLKNLTQLPLTTLEIVLVSCLSFQINLSEKKFFLSFGTLFNGKKLSLKYWLYLKDAS